MKKTILGLGVMTSILCYGHESSSFYETLHDHWGQSFEISDVLFRENTGVQDLIIFENPRYGRVLALDGIIQLTTEDEFIYHEMIVHVPMLAHGNAKKVLIIGGGDGGSLREVVRHPTTEQIDLVDIDDGVIEMSKKYFPTLSNGAFEDSRVNIIIADGAEYIANCEEKYDVIICDTTDPIGPGEVLFTKEFYGNCKKCLAQGGIMSNQDSIPMIDHPYMRKTKAKRMDHFSHTTFYKACVPTYVGGEMAFGFSSDTDYMELDVLTLSQRLENVHGEMRYYSPELHKSAFVWPAFLQKTISE